jgi:hypothetical protein
MAQIEISDAAYERIETLAKERGQPPTEWLEAHFSPSHAPVNADEGQPAREALAPYIGAVDSSKLRPDPRYRSEFGDVIDEKFTKQGLNPPKWER